MATLNQLFKDIQSRLQTDATVTVADDDIRFGEELGNAGVFNFPAILIVDTGDENAEHAGANIVNQGMDIMVFAEIYGRREDGESLVGDGSNKGVLEHADDVRESLRNYRSLTTGASGNNSVKTLYLGSDPTVIGFDDNNDARAMKVLHFSFEVQ